MALYHRTGRPIHAWRAYHWIRQAGLPPPPWFLEYLDRVAERVTKIAPGNGDDVAEAFDMGAAGRHSVECRRLKAAQSSAILRDMHPDIPLKPRAARGAGPRRRVSSAKLPKSSRICRVREERLLRLVSKKVGEFFVFAAERNSRIFNKASNVTTRPDRRCSCHRRSWRDANANASPR